MTYSSSTEMKYVNFFQFVCWCIFALCAIASIGALCNEVSISPGWANFKPGIIAIIHAVYFTPLICAGLAINNNGKVRKSLGREVIGMLIFLIGMAGTLYLLIDGISRYYG